MLTLAHAQLSFALSTKTLTDVRKRRPSVGAGCETARISLHSRSGRKDAYVCSSRGRPVAPGGRYRRACVVAATPPVRPCVLGAPALPRRTRAHHAPRPARLELCAGGRRARGATCADLNRARDHQLADLPGHWLRSRRTPAHAQARVQSTLAQAQEQTRLFEVRAGCPHARMADLSPRPLARRESRPERARHRVFIVCSQAFINRLRPPCPGAPCRQGSEKADPIVFRDLRNAHLGNTLCERVPCTPAEVLVSASPVLLGFITNPRFAA